MPLLQIVYASRPLGFDPAELLNILFKARQKNKAADVTGCLLCRDDLYLQLLEGPTDAVVQIYAKIQQDTRHSDVTEILRRMVDERMFERWAMRDDPVHGGMWSRQQVERGSVTRARAEEILGIFQRLASQPWTPN